jgi:hypothetical protein
VLVIQCELKENFCCCAGLDGGTSSQEREKLITAFNAKSNSSVFLFLLSTRYEPLFITFNQVKAVGITLVSLMFIELVVWA